MLTLYYAKHWHNRYLLLSQLKSNQVKPMSFTEAGKDLYFRLILKKLQYTKLK